jgi:CubicO group peptidase (beta-lactamase class C family)
MTIFTKAAAAALAASLCAGCATQPPAAVAAADWEHVRPEAVGLDPAALRDLVRGIRAGEHSNIHGVLLLRDGKLALEEYFPGADERRDVRVGSRPVGVTQFDANTLHDMRSISKSVVSILFGIAQSQGLVGGLDQPIVSYFPEYPDLQTDDRKAIKLRHLLSMTPGLEWDEDSQPYGDPANSETAMDNSPDRFRYVLERRIVAKPGTVWAYNGGTTILLGALLERATKMPLQDYAEKVLFRPLGITQYEWIRYADGRAIPASGLRLRPRDLARIAELYLQNGRWNGRQVVPEGWVKVSTSPQNPEGFYGFHWWVGGEDAGSWEVALGYGGQRANIQPAKDLIVIITAGLYSDRNQSAIVTGVLQKCIDAVVKPAAAATSTPRWRTHPATSGEARGSPPDRSGTERKSHM